MFIRKFEKFDTLFVCLFAYLFVYLFVDLSTYLIMFTNSSHKRQYISLTINFPFLATIRRIPDQMLSPVRDSLL